MENPANVADKQKTPDTSGNIQDLQVVTEEISPALLGAIQQIVSATIREQVAALAPTRIATPSDVEAPEEEPREAVPVPAPPTIRSSRKLQKIELSLFAVRQKDNEPLNDYLQRFNAAALEVPSAIQEVKDSAFSQGLLDGDFFKSLAKKLVSKFDALLAQAAKYINMEDAQAAKKESRGKRERTRRKKSPLKKLRTEFKEKKAPYQRINTVYTLLTVPITQALMAVEGKGLLTRPRSWKEGPQRPQSDKFFHFHNDYGHTTEECRHLKNKIERLIQNGYLQEYVCWKKARGRAPIKRKKQTERRSPKGPTMSPA
ncbi:UNVERIFIED_CONTAM: hypothetical protein Slati_3868400 [Sesamum latifolium]|uniref:Retrotransposon gag domain-containing protein n=1 Tax=Sesamum latifolium TaxID=2727402 RepID=A0AAW2TL33_9LAMI